METHHFESGAEISGRRWVEGMAFSEWAGNFYGHQIPSSVFQFRLANPTLSLSLTLAQTSLPPPNREVPLHGWRLVIVPCGLVLSLRLCFNSDWPTLSDPNAIANVNPDPRTPADPRGPNSWLALDHSILWDILRCWIKKWLSFHSEPLYNTVYYAGRFTHY